jgi:hypothetical protein
VGDAKTHALRTCPWIHRILPFRIKMTKKKKNQSPCALAVPACTCDAKSCTHACCIERRARQARRSIQILDAARTLYDPDSPGYKSLTHEMTEYGHVEEHVTTPVKTNRNLNPNFIDPPHEPSAIEVLGENMKNTLRSQEREQNLNRLIETMPALDKSSDVYMAMNFFYRTKCEADASDIQLRFKASIHKCGVQRFKDILRTADHTELGWTTACSAVLTSISKQFLSESKAALAREMQQKPAEDPSMYADRVMLRMDVYSHFVVLKGKTVDEEDMARLWVQGLLPDSVRMAASVGVSNLSSYTIKDALDVARVAHSACQRLAPVEPMRQMIPGPPDIDESFLQSYMDTAFKALEARIQSMVGTGSAPPPAEGRPTRYPCVHPSCNRALHRWADCPLKKPCDYCHKEGHHVEGCFSKHPHLSPSNMGRPQGGGRFGPGGRYAGNNRGRDYDRNRDSGRGRELDRARDRERSPRRERAGEGQPKATDKAAPAGQKAPATGDRLNEQGPA